MVLPDIRAPFVGIPTDLTAELRSAGFNALEKTSPVLAQLLGSVIQPHGAVPATRTRTTHAFALHAVSNLPTAADGTLRFRRGMVGAVHVVNMQQTRTVDDVWEVDAYNAGLPADVVPQALTGRTLTVARYDLWTNLMEQVFGQGEVIDLTDQARPFALREVWGSPGQLLSGRRTIYEYTGCWFTSLGRNLSADNNRIVNVDAQLVWTRRRRVL